MTFIRTLKQACLMFRSRFICYVIPAALSYGVVWVVTVLVMRIVILHWDPRENQGKDPLALWQLLSWQTKLIVVSCFLFSLWSPPFLAARSACRVSSNHIEGRASELRATIADVVRFVPVALLYVLLLGIPVTIGLNLFAIPGWLLEAALCLVIPAATVENLGALAAISRGTRLVDDVFFKAFLLFVAFAAIILSLFIGGSRIFGALIGWMSAVSLLTANHNLGMVLTAPLLVLVPLMLGVILLNIVFTLFFYDARSKAAGVDVRSKIAASGL